MFRRTILTLVGAASLYVALSAATAQAQHPRAFGVTWGASYTPRNWGRFYHYPYLYYPQNFWGQEYYQSADNLYYRYPQEMRIPVYNKKWFSHYPENRDFKSDRRNDLSRFRRYHYGHHFISDVF